jgi:probable phosphoglycerate mutase
MTARVDRVIARIRKIHADAAADANMELSDVIIFSHGHFSRSFIARWCDFPIRAGYHFAADAGGVSRGCAVCRRWV